MISIRVSKVSEKILFTELRDKISGMHEVNSAISKTEIANAIFSMSALDFIKNTNLKASSRGRRSLHHVYEWGEAGKESGRLFRIIKTNEMPGAMSIYYRFNNSKKVVPIPQALKSPGKTGKSVKKSKVFKTKAEFMESGNSASFTTNKTIVFLNKKNLVFIPKGKNITIKKPGGQQTTNGFSKHFISWWSTKPNAIARKSGMFETIEKNVAKALSRKKAGKEAARNAVKMSTSKYTLVRNVI